MSRRHQDVPQYCGRGYQPSGSALHYFYQSQSYLEYECDKEIHLQDRQTWGGIIRGWNDAAVIRKRNGIKQYKSKRNREWADKCPF